MAGDEERAMHLLSETEQALVAAVVRALVDRDEEALRRYGAYDGGSDPYQPTLRWRLWDRVDLVMPEGQPSSWLSWGDRSDAEDWTSIDIQMWTKQEQGPSDLILHLDVRGTDLLYRGMWT